MTQVNSTSFRQLSVFLNTLADEMDDGKLIHEEGELHIEIKNYSVLIKGDYELRQLPF